MAQHRFNHWLSLSIGCSAFVLLGNGHSLQAEAPVASSAPKAYPTTLPFEEEAKEELANDSLAAAISEMFVSNPELAARRFDLRATDDEIGLALSQFRPTGQLQVSGAYEHVIPGTITQSSRPLSDRLNNPNINRNDLTSQLIVDQPITTGGRAQGALAVALSTSAAGREALRGAEGDLLVDLIASYSDVRRDKRSLAIREKNVRVLQATLDEIVARREAGELTRTDIAQGETQLQAAKVQLNVAQAQLDASRAAFVAIVGREPGNLAKEPDLPNLPKTADEAFAMAELANPDLAAAMATERASRERIGVAKAEGQPEFSLRGTAGTTGPAVPFDRTEHDVSFSGRATLTIPLFAGGRVRSLVAQAQNRQSADALRVEATRRQMVQAIINAWNQWATAARNVTAQEAQLQAAKIYYEGTVEEYREGLRSTFDVLYAQNSLRETEIAVLASTRDRYVAQAVLLRHIGQLEARNLLTTPPHYAPEEYTRRTQRRSALPWDPLVQAIDGVGAPSTKPQTIRPPVQHGDPEMAPSSASPAPPRDLMRQGPAPKGALVPERSREAKP